MNDDTRRTQAYVIPFAVFMGFTCLWQFAAPFLQWDHPSAAWWQRCPEQWIYPLQAIVCFLLVILYRHHIAWDWKLKPALIGILYGLIGIFCWLAPTMIADKLPGGPDAFFGQPDWPWYRYLLGIDPRPEGFNPGKVFASGSTAFYLALILRFFRAVVTVALVEELFWRGYLMRFFVNDTSPWKVPFGQRSTGAYWGTTICFMLVHQPVDYFGAFLYGSLAYLLTVRRKNLCAVIIMHATANAVLGWVAVSFGKPGLW